MTRTPEEFAKWSAKYGVTVCSQTPSAFFALLPHIVTEPSAYAFKYFVLGGEKLEFGKLQPFFNAFGGMARYGCREPGRSVDRGQWVGDEQLVK